MDAVVHPSIALVRRACSGDADALDPAVEVRDSDGRGLRVIRGRADVQAWLARCAAEPDEMVGVAPDRVLGFTRSVGRSSSGLAVERRDDLAWTVRDGRVALVERRPAKP